MTARVALAMFTDGREHIFDEQRIASWEENLTGDFFEKFIFDDSADDAFTRRLRERFHEDAGWVVVPWLARRGFGGTIRRAWELLSYATSITHVFHLEDDFKLVVPVDLNAIVGVLDRHPHLVQLALRRQPWNDAEKRAGGIVELHPEAFDQCSDAYANWLEHQLFFTTNPSLYRRTLCDLGWPEGSQSEGIFTHRLKREGSADASPERVRFAFLGGRYTGVQVEHIGAERAGEGY